MRKVIDLQMEFWKKDIADIEFDLKSRDEIPKLMIGLQYIYSTRLLREKAFNILKQIVPEKSHDTGRPGMDLWKILVLGTLRLNCNWDYDKVHEMANNHYKLRQMLGHSETDLDSTYALQTIKDNIVLLTPQILDEINQLVVKAGHSIISTEQELRGSCDSFVVETDVHYPTDTNLLFDAMRKMIILIAIICSAIGITDWRQSHHHITKIKRLKPWGTPLKYIVYNLSKMWYGVSHAKNSQNRRLRGITSYYGKGNRRSRHISHPCRS